MSSEFKISNRFFSEKEMNQFKEKFGYNVFQIEYTATSGEIDFFNEKEKEFLFKYGIPKISARFGY